LARIQIDQASDLGKHISHELEQNRRLVAQYQPLPYAGPTLLIQCGMIDEHDMNREHLIRLTPLCNGWQDYLEQQQLSLVEVNASHRTIMHEDMPIAEVGNAVNSFVRSLTDRPTGARPN
jgi:hypothetical protein